MKTDGSECHGTARRELVGRRFPSAASTSAAAGAAKAFWRNGKEQFKLKHIATVISLCSILLTSQAAIVSVAFRGQLTDKYSNVIVPTGYQFGDPFSGRFSYDTGLPGVRLQQDTSWYDGFLSFEIEINGRKFTSLVAVGEITNNTNGGTEDVITVSTGTRSDPSYSLFGSTVDGYSPYNLQLQLRDPTASVFSSTELPDFPMVIDQFSSNDNAITLQFSGPTTEWRLYPIWGMVTEITTSISDSGEVPEPNSGLLLLAGVGVLGLVWKLDSRRSPCMPPHSASV